MAAMVCAWVGGGVDGWVPAHNIQQHTARKQAIREIKEVTHTHPHTYKCPVNPNAYS